MDTTLAARTLSVEECRDKLRTERTGHVAVSVGALPAVIPVEYEMQGDDVIFGAARGAAVPLPVADGIVALGADTLDQDDVGCWSVVVVGRAMPVPGDVRLRLTTDLVSGCEQTAG
jgi:nitroimidazol reductase NimA-like FMN-containing flavoprotein (pyridoxamine 5'-phosphate oxidase superfamily)